MIYTAESVTNRHPDKICDIISDAILDECLNQDPYSRVAIETMSGHGRIFLTGEVTTKAKVDYLQVVFDTYKELTGLKIIVQCNISEQSPDIAHGVDTGGAGDQGIMIGYACDDNEIMMPKDYMLARELLKPFSCDAKSQVTMDRGEIKAIVLSVAGKSKRQLERYLKKYNCEKFCNNAGNFNISGFDADAGVTGRKIVIDAYGPRVPVGGGAFSGKDPTKVDRSGAYMARWIAKKLLKENTAWEVRVRLAYVIGKADPIEATAFIDGVPLNIINMFDMKVESIIKQFDLRRPIYKDLAMNGHFGRPGLPWEKI